MNNSKINKLAIGVALSLSVAACGGGGGGGTSTTPTSPTTPTTPTIPTTPDNLDGEFTNYLTDLADNHIVPGYAAMSERAQDLNAEMTDFCQLDTPSQNNLTALREEWAAFNQAWQSVQWVKVGAVVEESRNFRIEFFPDNNNAVERGVDNLLLESQTVTADIVASQNVGGQGIPALERLLFPSSDDDSLLSAENKQKRCEVATAIAQNLVNVSEEIDSAWQPSGGDYRANLIEGTGEFTSVQDAVEELVTNWLENLELVKDEKLLYPLGDSSPGNVEIAELVLSDESLSSIEANINAFLTLYTAGNGAGFDDILNDTLGQDTINTQMMDALNASMTTIITIREQHESLDTLFQEDTGRALAAGLVDNLRDVRDVLTTGFVQALDINIGFNSNDGD